MNREKIKGLVTVDVSHLTQTAPVEIDGVLYDFTKPMPPLRDSSEFYPPEELP